MISFPASITSHVEQHAENMQEAIISFLLSYRSTATPANGVITSGGIMTPSTTIANCETEPVLCSTHTPSAKSLRADPSDDIIKPEVINAKLNGSLRRPPFGTTFPTVQPVCLYLEYYIARGIAPDDVAVAY